MTPIEETAQAHLRAVMESGTVARSTKELCAVMVSALNFCTPWLVSRRAIARKLGVSTEKLNAIWNYGRSDLYSEAEKAALAAAVALTREPRALPETIWMQLRKAYDEGQINELLSVIGLFNYFNRVSNALQLDVTH